MESVLSVRTTYPSQCWEEDIGHISANIFYTNTLESEVDCSLEGSIFLHWLSRDNKAARQCGDVYMVNNYIRWINLVLIPKHLRYLVNSDAHKIKRMLHFVPRSPGRSVSACGEVLRDSKGPNSALLLEGVWGYLITLYLQK